MASVVMDGQSSCFFEMMERLGIEPGGGVIPRLSLRYATALHRCKTCASRQACRAWLSCAPASESSAPPFCPNNDILFELQFDEPWIKTPALGQSPSPNDR